jgi:hypothetical protein
MSLTKVSYSMIEGTSINVLDFGAVADGVTDNTTAINNAAAKAFTNGNSLYFPAGIYLVSGKLTIGVPIFGVKSLIVSADWYGSTQYNTNSYLGSGSILVWNKSTLATTDTYIVPPSAVAETFIASNITFASRSSGGNGGGVLVERVDAGTATAFANLELTDCNIGNFATGIKLQACSEGNYSGIQFRGCRTAVFAGGSSATPSGSVTYTTFTGCQIEGCGSADSVYPCVNLDRTINIGFRDCVFQGTSDIRVNYILGTTLFDHCWMEAQSASENLLMKAVAGGTLQTIMFSNCYAGAASIGDINLTANVGGANFVMFNSSMNGMSFVLGPTQLLFKFNSANASITGGVFSYMTPQGDYVAGDGQFILTSSEASTKQLSIGSSTTNPRLYCGVQNGGSGNGFLTNNYFFQAGNQTNDPTKGMAALYLDATASTPNVSIGIGAAGDASPARRFVAELDKFYPGNNGGYSLGQASYKWSEVFAVNGTINTSDERSKQQVRSLTDKEKNVAVKCKQLICAFKFNDAVTLKNDSARIHFGVLAQDVQKAFESEGLNANEYGLFCYDEWDEKPEIKTDDGCIIQEYRAAGNSYGVRYDELLCFIIASI